MHSLNTSSVQEWFIDDFVLSKKLTLIMTFEVIVNIEKQKKKEH